jgi:hypothetical protein
MLHVALREVTQHPDQGENSVSVHLWVTGRSRVATNTRPQEALHNTKKGLVILLDKLHRSARRGVKVEA